MNYVQIRTATLRPGICLGFDVYFHISGKYILYIRRTDDITQDQLNRLYQKNVRELLINDEDLESYLDFIKESVDEAINDPKVPLPEKADIINGQSKASVEDLFADPNSREHYEHAELVANNQVRFLEKVPQAFRDMLKVSAHDNSVYQHSVNVSTISIQLAFSLRAPRTAAEVLGQGGLMHDIGEIRNPTLLGRTLEQMTDAEKELYLQHPRTGADVLSEKPYVSKDVLDVILLHEERLDGKGFPGGVSQLDQIYQVVGLANFYDRQVTFLKKSPKDAFDFINKIKPVPYDRRLIEGLQKILFTHKIF